MQTKIIIVGDREYGDIDTAKKLYRREREREREREYISRKDYRFIVHIFITH